MQDQTPKDGLRTTACACLNIIWKWHTKTKSWIQIAYLSLDISYIQLTIGNSLANIYLF